MNGASQKLCRILAVSVACLALVSAIPAQAGAAPSVWVPETEVLVDQATGQFSFTIQIDSQESYAGAEFGVICSEETEITAITSTAGSVTGPQAANGLIWFGFYDGQDSFCGETTVTVEGTCPTGTDCAVSIQDATLFTIGDQEYTTADLECSTVVNLRQILEETVPPTQPQAPSSAGMDMNVPALLICCAVIAAGAAGTLIYKFNPKATKKKEKEHASEQTE